MRYSIGDVSRVLGMTTSALHFYEKEGIINTPKQESGRRYYQQADINRLISAKKYRAMDVSVREIAQQFGHDGMTGSQVLERMREKRDEAARMARQYEGLSRDIDRLIELCGDELRAGDTVDIRHTDDILVFRSSCGGWIPRDKGEQEIARRWLEAMPAVCVSICHEQEEQCARFALTIPLSRAKDFGLDESHSAVTRIHGGMALHAVVACGEEMYDQPDVIFKPVMDFAKEHRFIRKDMMWGNQLVVDCSGGIRRHFYDTYMLFE